MPTLALAHRLLRLAALTLALVFAATPSYAKKSDLTPAKVKAAKRIRKSYENCRKGALAELKKGKLNKGKFEAALIGCQENFPGASLYVACKKSAVHTAKDKGISEDQAAAQCKRYLTATAFDPKASLPFFAEAAQLYFAGIGLNRAQTTTSVDPPNFDCARLAEVAKKPSTAEFILFGNHPRTFVSLADVRGEDLLKRLGLKKPSKAGASTPTFGKMYGDPTKASAAGYFPTAACDFEAEPGAIFAGLSTYYLMDQASSSVTPYFGIAYYREDQQAVTTPKLVAETLALLGSDFKSASKNKHVTFISQAPLTELDDEGDPKNVCRRPRMHHFVAVVQGHKDEPTRPEYLLIANIKNLCEFGDRLSKRLTD